MTKPWSESLSSLSDRWMMWCLNSVIEASLLLLLVSVLWFCIRRRVSPQAGYFLFLLVPLKLVLPFDVALPAQFAVWTPSVIASAVLKPPVAVESPQRSPAVNELDGVLPQPIPISANEVEPASIGSVSGESPLSEHFAGIALPSNSSQSVPRTVTSWSPSFTTWAMMTWLISVAAMLVRFTWIQARCGWFVNRLPATTESSLASIVHTLSQRIGLHRPVRIVVDHQIKIPAVYGLFRPTLLLPTGLETLLSAEQLEWVLLHELAHLRRWDLPIVALQRGISMLYCFNPAVWIANRIIHSLREYACDDLAVTLAQGTSIDSSEALLRILKQASQGSPVLNGSLGVFGLDARASCFQRLKRLLDTDRTIRIGLDYWSVCGLVLIAAIVLPRLHAADDPATKRKPVSDPNHANDVSPATAVETGRFELLVVGPDRKAVPNALVEIRTDPLPLAEQVLVGQFSRKANYGTLFIADGAGRLVIKLAAETKRFEASIITPGYGPYWASWTSENESQQIPAQFTAELEPAWSAGGLVVDSEGNPIEGVSIRPSINFKKRPGDQSQLGTGASVKSDAMGRWRIDHVPESYSAVHVDFNHPRFMPLRQSLPREDYGLDADRQPTRQNSRDRGLTVRGTVTADAGRPFDGVLVRTKFMNDIREAKTDHEGNYVLSGCEPRLARIVVSAKGKATDMQDVRINPEMEPVNFEMKPGGKIRVRVVDEQDRPIPKSRIFFQGWRGKQVQYFEFNHVNQYCDDQGVWEWNEAPLDSIQADICPPGGMMLSKQTLVARDEEFVFKPPTALIIAGRVIDAETKTPIKKFNVLPGLRFENGRLHWAHKERFSASNGKFRLERTDGRQAYLVRIEASGYRTFSSRDIQFSEGQTQLEIEMVKGQDVVATIVAPDGNPAANAEVALGIAGTQINLQNGEFREISTYCEILTSNAEGQIQFPQQDGPYHLIVVHPTGCAHLLANVDSKPDTIKLQPWGRIEGTFRVGSKPSAGTPLTIDQIGLNIYEQQGSNITTSYRTVTGTDGKYAFERVWPGHGWLGREIIMMVNEGAIEVTSAAKLPINVEPGESCHIDLGGNGRPIVGRLQSGAGDAKNDWKQLLVQVEPRRPELPPLTAIPIPDEIGKDLKRRTDWVREWQQTEPGKAWLVLNAAHEAQQRLRQNTPYYRATLTEKGDFRIDDVPEGNYTLSILFRKGEHHFTVPAVSENQADQELDLGVLELQ